MKKILLFLSIILSYLYVYAQSDEISKRKEIDGYIAIANQFKNTSNFSNYAHFLNKIAYNYWEINELDKALTYFSESLKVNEDISNLNALQILNTNLGIINNDLGNTAKALEHFILAQNYSLLLNDNTQIVSGYLNISLILAKLDSNNEAIQNIHKAIHILKKHTNSKLLKNSYGRLIELHIKENNTDSADFYLSKYDSIEKNAKNNEQTAVNKEKTKHSLDEGNKKQYYPDTVNYDKEVTNILIRNLELELIKKDETIAKLRIEAQKNTVAHFQTIRTIVILLIIALIIITIFYYISIKKTNTKKREFESLLLSVNKFFNQFSNPIFVESKNNFLLVNKSAEKFISLNNKINNETTKFSDMFAIENFNEGSFKVFLIEHPSISYTVNIFQTTVDGHNLRIYFLNPPLEIDIESL